MPAKYPALRAAFLVGAVTDALAILPMLLPSLAGTLWGFEEYSPAFRFATNCAASLIFGWTALLIWAYQCPIERRAVAGLTIVVIVGLVMAEVVAVQTSLITPLRMAPTWLLQAALIALFAVGLSRSRPPQNNVA